MDWQTLLSPSRYYDGKFETRDIRPETHFLSHHSRDPDRVLFSSAFRRLQGKTQVYIFPQTDFVRNRLTHSLEVSSIGRSLAIGIYKKLNEQSASFRKIAENKITPSDFSDCVAAACLAHDLGNPPFGHVGEYAIRSWFREPSQVAALTPHRSMEGRRQDFDFFDGNAQAFRVVTRLQGWGYHDGGLRLTAATLGALVKYPNNSNMDKQSFKVGKYGYYKEDEIIFEKLAECLGLIKKTDNSYSRHPLSFVTEAADDIAYLTSDVEDARKYGMISFEQAESMLLGAAKKLNGFDVSMLDRIKNPKGRLAYLRSTASLAMIQHCVRIFVQNEDVILAGDMNKSLLSTALPTVEKNIRSMNENEIYHKYKKIKAETGAYEVIRSIMKTFSEALNNRMNDEETTERSKNLIKLMDPVTRDITNEKDAYRMHLALLDFLSGMTDRYAMDIFETTSGRKLVLGF